MPLPCLSRIELRITGLNKMLSVIMDAVRMCQRPYNSQMLCDPSVARHQIANLKPRKRSVDRLKWPTNLGRRLRLQVNHIDMRWATSHPEQNDRFRRSLHIFASHFSQLQDLTERNPT
jgi:hypothetical protein